MISLKKEAKFCPYCGGKLKKKFIEGRERLFCTECGFVIFENPTPVVAAVLIEGEKILLVKRGIPPKKGFWSLPAGFIDVDESAEETLIREMKEETNLDIKEFEPLGTVNQKSLVHGWVLVIGFLIKKYRGIVKAGDDAEEAKFFNINSLPQFPFKSHEIFFKRAIEKIRGKKPSLI